MLTKEEIISAIRNATSGTFVCPGGGVRTCMGWIPRFDKNGNPIGGDPNYVHTWITIENESFGVTVRENHVWIFRDPEKISSYTSVWCVKDNQGGWGDALVADFDI